MKPPVSYYGGKQNMISLLKPLIPEHKTYCEVFAGGAALFFAKLPSKIEVINDINGNVTNFYLQMKNNPDELTKMIENTLHCEFTYNKCREIYRGRIEATDLEKAHAFWVGATMSFGSSVFDGSFQITANSSDSCHPGVRTKNKRDYFKKTLARIEKAMILNKDAISVIKKYDNEKTFIYADPPYVGTNQGHYRGYKLDQFQELLNVASSSKSKILISCYYHEILENYDFIMTKHEMRLGVKNGGIKIECLVRNYDIKNNLFS